MRVHLRTGLAMMTALLAAAGWLVLAPGTGWAAGGVTVSSTTVSFPDTPVGDMSATATVTFTNTGSATTNPGIGGGSLMPATSNFIYDGENCPTTLNPGDSCQASYQFNPHATGPTSGTAQFTFQGGTLTITVRGTGIPDFAVSGTTLAFPDTPVGLTSTTLRVTLTNRSSQSHTPSLAGGALFSSTEFHSLGQTCGAVAPGASCGFNYNFAPTALGSFSTGTTIGVDGSNYPITVTGRGVSGLTITPTTLDFPTTPVGSMSAPLAVTLTNTSGQTIHPAVGGGALASGTEFVYDGENCPSTFAPGDSCTASYEFAPRTPGPHTDTAALMVAGGTVTITLHGTDGTVTTTTSHPTTHTATTTTSHHSTTTSRASVPTTRTVTVTTAAPSTNPSTAESTVTAASAPGGSSPTAGSESDAPTTLPSAPGSITAASTTSPAATASSGGVTGPSPSTVAVALSGTSTPTSGTPAWVWIVIAVVVAAGVAAGGFLLGRRRNPPPADQ